MITERRRVVSIPNLYADESSALHITTSVPLEAE